MYFPDACFDKVLKCGPIVIVLSLFYARYKSTQTKCLIKMHTGFTKHFHLQKLQSIGASLMRQHRSQYKLWCNICAPTIALWLELTIFVPISTCIFLFQKTGALRGSRYLSSRCADLADRQFCIKFKQFRGMLKNTKLISMDLDCKKA